jgi:hypothetical protein
MVEIEINTTVLPGEFIAHRLGMFPFNSENCDEGIRYAMGQQSSIFIFPTYIYISILTTQDGIYLAGCRFCAMKLVLHVICNENRMVDVTSNHLDVRPICHAITGGNER